MEHVSVLPFWTRRRLLRGALTPPQAVLLAASATAALLWAHILVMREDVALGAPALLGAVVIAPLTVAAFVDSVCHLLPDPLLLVAGLLTLPSLMLVAARGEYGAIATAAVTAGCALAVGLALSSVFSFGRGDAKLLGVLGLWLGSPAPLLSAVIVALVGAGLYAVILMVARRATRTTALALGPWLVGGAALLWTTGA
ncbi:MAG: prepilin peptidase [Ancrocorticia sp.]